MRILVTEDEKDLADAIAKGLRRQGYAVDIAYDGQQALDMVEINGYDLIVLDLNLPLVDGVEVCKNIRSSGLRMGVLMLTARTGLDDRVNGLDIGADDYLTKPFHFPELLARIRAILRREGEVLNPILRINDLVLDTNSQKSYFKDKETKLTTKEFAILEYLMRNAGRIISQEELLEHVWNDDANLFTHSVKVHIMNLRKKLDASGIVNAISTVKGRGYIV